MDNIQKNLKTYAENESYAQALSILQQQHFVIISGLPGVGKTTLARMMAYWLLGKKDFDEFCICIRKYLTKPMTSISLMP